MSTGCLRTFLLTSQVTETVYLWRGQVTVMRFLRVMSVSAHAGIAAFRRWARTGRRMSLSKSQGRPLKENVDILTSMSKCPQSPSMAGLMIDIWLPLLQQSKLDSYSLRG